MKTNPILRLKCAAVALSLLAVSGFSALAATLTVTNPNDSGPGSLRDAISAAASGDKINFAPALNGQTITLTSGELLITQALNIQGPGANQLTVSGNQASRVFHSVTDVTLAGLTITNGRAADFGGGVFHESGTLTVTKCVILGNTATGANSRGGGVYAGASIIMKDSTVSQNSAGNGGGIYTENPYYSPTNNFVSATISRSTIDHNTASVGGGGIYTKNYGTLFGNTTIAYNSAPAGGGVYIDIGGAEPGPSFLQCTITGNSANPNSGGGIYIVVSANNFDAYFLENSIVAFQQSGGNIIGNNVYYNIDGSIFTDDPNLNLDPNGLQDNGGPTKTIALLSGSSAIDAGTPANGPSDVGIDGSTIKDQRGGARPVGNGPDIGAYEYNPSSCATVVTNTNDNGPGSLRCAINSAFTGDTITFAPNLGPQINLTSGELLIQKDLTILGPGAKVLTVSGSSLSRVFRVNGVRVSISGLTIANGLTPSIVGPVVSVSGAGILVSSPSGNAGLTLSACTVTNNQANAGSVIGVGITISGASATISNCTVSNNHVVQGPNVSAFSTGGGIGSNTLGGDVTIVNSTISGNTNYQGGGIGINNPSSANGHLTIVNSTISGNTATLSGGGLYFRSGFVVLGSTLMALNSAPTGPDIFTDPLVSGNPTVNSAGYNLVGTAVGYTWINGAGDQLGIANPGLQLDANNLPLLKDNGGPTQTIALVPGSPAIDRGFADASLTTDQRSSGFARVTGAAADVGAMEAAYTTLTGPAMLPSYGQAFNVTATVANATSTGTETVQFVVDGANYGSPVSLMNGSAVASISGLITGGSHTITAIYANGGGLQEGNSDTLTESVNQADTQTVVTCSPSTEVYNGSPFTPCSATVTGPNGLNQSVPVTYMNNTNVGTATVNADYAGDSNYKSSSGSGTFQITPAPTMTSIQCPSAGQTFTNSAITPCSATVSGPGLSQSVQITYMNNVNVGTATANAGYPAGGNYQGSNGSGTFQITPAPTMTTVQCPVSVTYAGGPVMPCNASVSGPGLSQSLTPTYMNNVNVGSATANASYADGGNYQGSNASKMFAITKATLTVTANNVARLFGQPNPAFSASYNGFKGSDNFANSVTGAPSFSTTATQTSPVGNYNITVSQGTLMSNNYQFGFAPGTLTIYLDGIIGLNGVTISSSGALVDSYNSAVGPYNTSRGSQALLLANTAVNMKGGTVGGMVDVAAGSLSLASGSVITGNTLYYTTLSSQGKIQGTITHLTSANPFVAPLPPAMTSYTAAGNWITGSKFTYDPVKGNLTVNGGTVTIANGTYNFNNVTISGGATLKVNGLVVIHLTGVLNASGGSVANNSSQSADLQFVSSYTGSQGVNISGGSQAYFSVYAPGTDVTISGTSPLYGALIGKTLTISGASAVHFDLNLQSIWAAYIH